MSQTRYEWNCHFAGQRRAYADTTTEGVLTVEHEPYNKLGTWEPWDISEDFAKRVAQAIVGWTDKGEGDWFSTRLTKFEKVAPGQWYILTTRAYDD